MAVDRFKDIESQFKVGAISESEALEQIYSRVYEEEVQKALVLYYKKLTTVTPTDFWHLEQVRVKLEESLELYRLASLNQKGEVRSGITIRDVIIRLLSVNPVLAPFLNLAKTLSEVPNLFDRYISELIELFHSASEINSKRLDPALVKPKVPSFLKQVVDEVSSPASSSEIKSILFSDLYGQFLAYKKLEVNLSEKMQGDYSDYVKTFVFALGDLPINQINKKVVKQFLQTYARLPKRNLKIYKDKSIDELWGKVVPEADRIATRTMLGAKKFLLGIFRFAVNQDYLTVSPAVDLDMKIKLERKRGHFTDAEVRKILVVLDSDDHISQNEWQKWAVLFGAYTGARAGEVSINQLALVVFGYSCLACSTETTSIDVAATR